MKYYIHTDNNKLNGHGICKTSDSSIEVTEEIYNDYSQNPLKYTLKDNKVIPNPNIESEITLQNNLEKITQIENKLKTLDEKRIRAICENEIKDTQTGETWLDYYNKQIINIRKELKEIKA